MGIRGLERVGKKKWRRHVADVVARLIAALEPDDVVLGGGNVKKLKELPPGCRPATTPMPSSEGFACGRSASDAQTLPTPPKIGTPISHDQQRKEHEDDEQAIASHSPQRPAWKALAAHYQEGPGAASSRSSSRTIPSAASA